MEEVEATLRILCMTDSKEGIHTLEKQEEFAEIVKSRDVEVTRTIFVIPRVGLIPFFLFILDSRR